MNVKPNVYRAASEFFLHAHGLEFTSAEGTHDAHTAIVAAFHLYERAWTTGYVRCDRPRFAIRDWRWPFNELQHGGPFAGNEPWTILLRFAVERLRALKSPDRPVDLAGFEEPAPLRTVTGETLVDVRTGDDDLDVAGIALADVIGDDESELPGLIAALAKDGRATVGGGAAPGFTLVLHEPDPAPDLLTAARDVLEWAGTMGGWEAPCWDRLRAAVNAAEAR